jgi:asparagine synthase (glutamine-hydrolysing)
MSQLFGCISFNSGIDIEEVSLQLQESTSFFKADATGIYQTCDVFICNKFLINTPESPRKNIIFRNEQYILAASCRIDNREELAAKIPLALSPNDSDHAYLLAAYTFYQEECVRHLIGDFSFIVWDIRNKTLFMARDHVGVKPLFYAFHKGVLFFSSDLNALSGLQFINAAISESYIASALYGDFILTSAGIQHTCYRDVFRVKPAHYHLFSQHTRKEVKYWELKPMFSTILKTKQEYYHEFYELFKSAIHCRMRGIESFNVGLELSGGLDSSAIACMSGEVMDTDRQFFTHLQAYSLVQSTQGQAYYQNFHDEEPFQELVLNKLNLNRENIFKLNRHPFDSYKEEFEYGLAVHGGLSKVNFTWQKAIYETMHTNNCRVKLSGFAGDECITDGGEWWLFDILFKTDLKVLLQELMRFNRANYKTILKYLYYRIFGYRVDKQTKSKTEDSDYLQKACKKILPAIENKINTKSFKDYLISKITRPYTSLRFETETLHALRYNVESRFPMADIRLLDFMLRLPPTLFRPEENKRQFIRNALGAILPDAVRYRKDKSSAVVPYYKYKNAVFINQLLAAKPVLTSNMVNTDKIAERLANPDKLKRESDVASLLAAIYIADKLPL